MALYNIVVQNLRRFSVFAPKIVVFRGLNDIYNTRKYLYYKSFRVGVFFLKKFSRAEDYAENVNLARNNEYRLFHLFCQLGGCFAVATIALGNSGQEFLGFGAVVLT